MNEEEMELQGRVLEEWDELGHRSRRGIARKLGVDVKNVRKILEDNGRSKRPAPRPSKLEPFKERIKEMVDEDLNNARILKDLRKEGYQGGKTILGEFIRELRGPRRRPPMRYRRFETAPAVEAQADWSVFRVQIAGVERVVHFFAIVLCWSRYLFVGAYRNEKLPTLLAAHTDAFAAFGGTTREIVYDNMSTVTLGRRDRQVVWNPRFLEFARHWMYEPRVCRPRQPNRKGKIEKPFSYLRESLIRGSAFDSWDHLHTELAAWLCCANQRKHGTTGRVPLELWHQEQPLLTEPPETPFPTYRELTRGVYPDCTISVDGVRYSVPATLGGRTVSVRVHPRHIEVVDERGALHARHQIHEREDGLVIDPSHYESIRGPARSASQIDREFLDRFRGAAQFLDGLKARMKSLYHIHVSQIERLARIYGEPAVEQAIARAARYANYNANAVERMLRDQYPLKAVEPEPLAGGSAATLAQLDEMEDGSLDDYAHLDFDDEEDDDDDHAVGGAA